MDDVVRAEQRREFERKADAPKLIPPPVAFKYDVHLLERARQIGEATERLILNPRDIESTSLLDADADWLSDYIRYLEHLQYRRDKDKRPTSLR